MSKYSDGRLANDIIQIYQKYQQSKDNFKNITLKNKTGAKNDFLIPKSYQLLDICNCVSYSVGKGSYGVVVAAVDKNRKQDGEVLAIKKIQEPFEHKILTKRILRELHLLRLLKHENIIQIKTILMPISRSEFKNVYIVFEFMDTDLHEILKSDQHLTKQHFKFFLYQLIRALKYIHSAGIVHRDLKPRNLLVNKNCDLKVCDFGLARSLMHKSKSNELTDYVATRWYRAPQLLLGSNDYTAAVDMWSVGCIFAQMLQRKPFMKGKTTKEQLQIIAEMIGIDGLQEIESISEGSKRVLKKLSTGKGNGQLKIIFSKAEKEQLDLLVKLLNINPSKRITAQQALKHPYFSQLHDPNDEPQVKPFGTCDFQFEQHNLNTQQLKDILYEQILTYNFPEFQKQYERKRNLNLSLISHILTNSNKDNKDPVADQSEDQFEQFQ